MVVIHAVPRALQLTGNGIDPDQSAEMRIAVNFKNLSVGASIRAVR